MTLILAQRYAAKLFTWLQPNTERVMIAGSIRRERPEPADIDLCVIPKLTIYRDMFGAETGRQNHCWMFLQNYVANFNPATRALSGVSTSWKLANAINSIAVTANISQ